MVNLSTDFKISDPTLSFQRAYIDRPGSELENMDLLAIYRSARAFTLAERAKKPKTQVYNIIIKAYLNFNTEECDKELKAIMREMQEEKVPFNQSTYTLMIQRCAMEGTQESLLRAKMFLKKMIGEGILPNVITYTSLIKVCAKIRTRESLHYALELLQEMKDNDIKPDKLIYFALLNTCARVGTADSFMQAVLIFSEMTEKEIKPDSIAYKILNDAFQNMVINENGATITQCIQELQTRELQLPVDVHDLIVDELYKLNCIEEAKAYFKKIPLIPGDYFVSIALFIIEALISPLPFPCPAPVREGKGERKTNRTRAHERQPKRKLLS